MVFPEALKIGGHTVRVVQLPSWDLDGSTGELHVNDHVIKIARELPESMKEAVLLHEILEFIDNKFELGLEHRVIQCLEEMLYQVLKDNGLGFA